MNIVCLWLFYFASVEAASLLTRNPRLQSLIPAAKMACKVASGATAMSGMYYGNSYLPHLENNPKSRQFWLKQIQNAPEGSWLAEKQHIPRFVLEDSKDFNGNTALQQSIIDGDCKLAHNLVKAGSDPNARNPRTGQSILDVVAETGKCAHLIVLLQKNGCDFQAINPETNLSAADVAFQKRNLPILKSLLMAGCLPNSISLSEMAKALCREGRADRQSKELNDTQRVLMAIFKAAGYKRAVLNEAYFTALWYQNGLDRFISKIEREYADTMFF